MKGHGIWRGIKVGFTIIGTTIGAGFASGREIWEFFGSYGPRSMYSLMIAMILFAVTSIVILWISHKRRTDNYYELLEHLMGSRLGRLFDVLILVYLLSMSVVMFAGSGATFSQWGIPYLAGVMVIAITVYIVVLFDVKGLMSINTLVIPVLIAILLFVTLQFIRGSEGELFAGQLKWQPAWPSGIIYAALNITPLLAVLSTMGREMKSASEIYIAGGVSTLGLGSIAYLLNHSLLKVGNDVNLYEIPLFSLLKDYPVEMILVVSFVLWIAIFTTVISGIYGIVFRLHGLIRLPLWVISLVLIIGIIPLSYFGFSTLVKLLYPLYGMINLFVLVCLVLYPFLSDGKKS
ncbi:MAG: GerAB/ArcD/ProY family transporter [Bacillaceae bacterium]|nr:GerAB/ArcD/ProY family transporter [Bacillaceae bacterium]